MYNLPGIIGQKVWKARKAGKAIKKAVSSSAFCVAGQNNIQVFYTFQTINMDGWPAFFIPNEG